MRRILLVLLGFGVFAGYGSAIASARWHHRHGGDGGGCESRWSRGYDRDAQRSVAAPAPAPVPAAAPQTIVMPQAAAAAPQIFLIMPGAQAAPVVPQVITVPAAAPAAPAPATP